MNPIYKELGQLVLKARDNAKISQETLSKRIGLSRTSITNIEKGRQQIQLHTLFSLADALGISPSELLPDKTKLSMQSNLVEVDLSALPMDVANFVNRVAQSK
jgi:transcriptional regulator with XRE-family HTH domain